VWLTRVQTKQAAARTHISAEAILPVQTMTWIASAVAMEPGGLVVDGVFILTKWERNIIRESHNFSERAAFRRVSFQVDPDAFEDILNKIRALAFKGSATKEDIEYVGKMREVALWLKQVGFSSREEYLKSLIYYTKCSNLNPAALLDLKLSEDPKRGYYPAEELLQSWIDLAEETKCVTSSRIWNEVNAVRSFYMHSRVPLQPVDYVYVPKEKDVFDENNLKKFREGFDFYGKVLFDFILSVPLRDGQFQICRHCGQDFYPRWRNITTYPKIEPYSPFVIKTQKGHEKKTRRRISQMQVCYLTPSAVDGLNTLRSIKEAALGRRLRPDEYIFTHTGNNGQGVLHITPIGTMNVIGTFKHAEQKTGEHITVHRARDWVYSVLACQGIEQVLRDLYLGHETNYQMGYLMQLITKWQKTFRKAKALEALDIRPPSLKKDPLKELVAGLGFNAQDLETFQKVLKAIGNRGL